MPLMVCTAGTMVWIKLGFSPRGKMIQTYSIWMTPADITQVFSMLQLTTMMTEPFTLFSIRVHSISKVLIFTIFHTKLREIKISTTRFNTENMLKLVLTFPHVRKS